MLHPEKVRSIVEAISSVVSIPVTVKCRIGVDGLRCFFRVSVRPRFIRGIGSFHICRQWLPISRRLLFSRMC